MKAALDHPGNAVVKPLTVGFDPWEAHELGGDDNTTNSNSVTINRIQLGIISTFLSTCPSSPPSVDDAAKTYTVHVERCTFPQWDGTDGTLNLAFPTENELNIILQSLSQIRKWDPSSLI